MARGDKFAFLAKKWRVVDGEEHVHRRLVDRNTCQSLWIFHVCNSISDFKIIDTGYCTDITSCNGLNFEFTKTFKGMKFFDTHLFDGAVRCTKCNLLIFRDTSSSNTADGNTSHKVGVIQGSDLHLQGAFFNFWLWDVINNRVQKRYDGVGWVFPVRTHPVLFC